ASASSANSMRGCFGLGTMRSRGISLTRSAPGIASAAGASIATGGPSCAGAPGINAPRPRPSAFLVMVNDLLRECPVTCCTAVCSIVVNDRFSEAGRLAEADIARDHRAVDPVGEKLPSFVGDLLREVHARVEHREQDALDAKPRVQVFLDELDRPHELGQS